MLYDLIVAINIRKFYSNFIFFFFEIVLVHTSPILQQIFIKNFDLLFLVFRPQLVKYLRTKIIPKNRIY